jgi:DNA-binding response OmpR family regulator
MTADLDPYRQVAPRTAGRLRFLRVGPIEANLDGCQVHVRGAVIPLALKDFDLLTTLMRNAGHVMTHRQLLDQVWSTQCPDDSRLVTVHVTRLHARLAAHPDALAMLRCLHGVGYILDTDPQPHSGTARAGAVLSVGIVTADLAARRVHVGSTPVLLPRKEFDLLVELMRHAGQVVGRRALLDRIWRPGYPDTNNTLAVHARRVRNKLAEREPSLRYRLRAVPGKGYVFDVSQTTSIPASQTNPDS